MYSEEYMALMLSAKEMGASPVWPEHAAFAYCPGAAWRGSIPGLKLTTLVHLAYRIILPFGQFRRTVLI